MDSINHRLPASIETDRLVLTTPTLAHVPDMAVLANSRAIYQVLARLPHPYAESDGRFFVETIARGASEFAWSILRDGHFIGVISLIGIDGNNGPAPEIGYWLGEPFWGQGYATEAALAVVAAARAAGLPMLRATALTSNTGSRRVLAKAGFIETHEGPSPHGTNAGAPTMFMQLVLQAGRAGTLPATVRTARLNLRAPALRDLPDIVALANNPRMVETTATLPFPFTESDGRQFIASANGPDQRAWAIAGSDDRFVGTMLFKLVQGKRPEVGYWLGEPHWGQGYAAEALQGLLAAVRGVPGFASIDARVLQSNPASVRVLDKSGFVTIEHTTSVVDRHRGKPVLAMQWSAP